MLQSRKRTILILCACLVSFAVPAVAQEVPPDYQEVLKALDRKGDFKSGVLKVNIPRNDLKITIQGVPRLRRLVLAAGSR